MQVSQISTINVVTYIDGAIFGLQAFEDTEDGNVMAEELFKCTIRADFSETSEEEIEECTDNGVFESEQGDVQIFIVHSS